MPEFIVFRLESIRQDSMTAPQHISQHVHVDSKRCCSRKRFEPRNVVNESEIRTLSTDQARYKNRIAAFAASVSAS